jgi:hypothetical protein
MHVTRLFCPPLKTPRARGGGLGVRLDCPPGRGGWA